MHTLEAINHCPWNHASLCAHIFHSLKRLRQYTYYVQLCRLLHSMGTLCKHIENHFIATRLCVHFCFDAEINFVCTNNFKIDTVYFRNRSINICFDFLLPQVEVINIWIHSFTHISSADLISTRTASNFDSCIFHPWCGESGTFFLLAWLVGNNIWTTNAIMWWQFAPMADSNIVKMAFKKGKSKSVRSNVLSDADFLQGYRTNKK